MPLAAGRLASGARRRHSAAAPVAPSGAPRAGTSRGSRAQARAARFGGALPSGGGQGAFAVTVTRSPPPAPTVLNTAGEREPGSRQRGCPEPGGAVAGGDGAALLAAAGLEAAAAAFAGAGRAALGTPALGVLPDGVSPRAASQALSERKRRGGGRGFR